MKKALIFSAAVCAVSWGIYALVMATCSDRLASSAILMTVLKSAYMFLPMLTALAIQTITGDWESSRKLVNFRLSWTWLVAMAAVVACVFLAIPFSALIPGVSLHFGPEQLISMNGLEGEQAEMIQKQLAAVPPAALVFSTMVSGIIAGCTINAIFAFGEEYGWRNYMVGALQGVKFWKAALLIGTVWGIWHAPLILAGHNYPQHPQAGVVMMCVFCILAGVLELYFVLKTRSAIVAAVMHGCINAMAGIVTVFVLGGDDLTIGLTGAGGFIALAAVIAAVYAYDSRHDRIMASELKI